MKFRHCIGAIPAIIVLFSLFYMNACSNIEAITDLSKKCIIPVPQSVDATFGAFEISKGMPIVAEGNSEDLQQIASYLAAELQSITGMDAKVVSASKKRKGIFYLRLSDDNNAFPKEGYRLLATKDTVILEAGESAGLFYGIQTLKQVLMLGSCIYYEPYGKWIIPTGEIRDHPEYMHRGVMLDVARHFFSVEDVKHLMDLMVFYKLNVLHLHLTDDQGWRIEIKSWPKLTAIGGSTQVGGKSGGFYSQEEYKEIVDYAADHYITVIPEIEMPGHSNAALASYAELNCDDQRADVYTGIDVGFSSLCTSKEITYAFIEDVIGELAAITQGPYIHIGADESDATPLEEYIPFVERVQAIIRSHGKQMIGWDEIAQSNLDPSTVVQFWDHPENAQRAVDQGSKIIMSPAERTYLDMKYHSATMPGLDWAGYIDVNTAYLWDMETYVEGISRDDILGIESPIWTETLETRDDIEYMAFPRLIGHAELGWSRMDQRNWDYYRKRLAHHGMLMDMMGVNYYRSEKVGWLGSSE